MAPFRQLNCKQMYLCHECHKVCKFT
uniref:Uncharacterized protein n=1 Tax=Arundo donax TaxID=35708 RepID=A0A0A8YQD4_ARUDO